MRTDTLTLCLIAVYVIAAAGYAWERNWPKCLYFVGAAILTCGVVMKA